MRAGGTNVNASLAARTLFALTLVVTAVWLSHPAPRASAADLLINGSMVPLGGAHTYDNVYITNGGQLVVTSSLNLTITGSLVIDATSRIDARTGPAGGVSAGALAQGTGAGGPGGATMNSSSTGGGGAGGSHGGLGGLGGTGAGPSGGSAGIPGPIDGSQANTPHQPGSGGGGGGRGVAGIGGAGGRGGEAVVIVAASVQIDGAIDARGMTGATQRLPAVVAAAEAAARSSSTPRRSRGPDCCWQTVVTAAQAASADVPEPAAVVEQAGASSCTSAVRLPLACPSRRRAGLEGPVARAAPAVVRRATPVPCTATRASTSTATRSASPMSPQRSTRRPPTPTRTWTTAPPSRTPRNSTTTATTSTTARRTRRASTTRRIPTLTRSGDECDTDDDNDGRTDADRSLRRWLRGLRHSTPLLRDTDGDRFLDNAECAVATDPYIKRPRSLLLTDCGAVGDADGDKISNRASNSVSTTPTPPRPTRTATSHSTAQRTVAR